MIAELFFSHFNAAAAADRRASAAAIAFVHVNFHSAAQGFFLVLHEGKGLFGAFFHRRTNRWLRGTSFFDNHGLLHNVVLLI
jgi:hypothetical protein